jgi:hypothetical protein
VHQPPAEEVWIRVPYHGIWLVFVFVGVILA